MTKDERDLDARISRTEEWMVAQCLFSGKIQCLDGDDGKPVAEIDYGPINLTVTQKPWSDPTSAPLTDLKNCMRIVAAKSGYAATLICMGKDAGDAFESNDQVLQAYNKYNITPGVIDPKTLQDMANFGVTALGTYRQLPLFVDEAQYENPDGTFSYYVPPGAVLVAAAALQSKIAYAAVAQIDETETYMQPFEGARIPQIWFSKGEETRMFRLAARPIPVPADTTSWTVLQAI
jgi:major capsid protein E